MSRFVINDVMWEKPRQMLPSPRGTIAVIPSKKNRREPIEHDAHIYKERNHVERFFNRIKGFRRIATRYDKTAVMYLGALTITSILLWLKL